MAKKIFFCILFVLMTLVSLISPKDKGIFFGSHLCIRSFFNFFPPQNQVKHILNHQDHDKSPKEIERLEHSNKPEPTREEVIEATMKELDKMKRLTLGNEEMQSSK